MTVGPDPIPVDPLPVGPLPGVGGGVGAAGGGLLGNLLGLTELGHWVGAFVTALTDKYMWISLGWLALGLGLLTWGILMWLRPQRLLKYVR